MLIILLTEPLDSVSNLSPKPIDKWFAQDKLHHLSYSMGITGLSYHIYHCKFNNPDPGAKYFSISIATTTAFGKELYDRYCKKSNFSYKDLIVDAVGIIIGVWLFTG